MAVYLRPTAFVDTPVGFDGQVLRLAGGLCFFSAIERIEVRAGKRSSTLVPVNRLDGQLDDEDRVTLGRLIAPRRALQLGERTVRLDEPRVMGIINVTPDSFADGGAFAGSADAAIGAGVDMISAGAAIVDVGGESTRPGARPVWEGDEIARTKPVIEGLARGGAAVSIDTRKAAVMTAALMAGATLVNDVSALLHDRQAVTLMAARHEPIIIMHSPDASKTLHDGADYADVVFDVYDWLADRIAALERAGILRDRLVIDPGIGFGKGLADNLALLNGLALFHGLGLPVMIGASRKRFIGALANAAPVTDRLGGSLTVALKAAEQGAQIVRVHDVAETVQALQVWRGLRDAGLSAR